jgi:hypothetical protein
MYIILGSCVLCRGQELLRLRMVEQPNVLLAIILCMYIIHRDYVIDVAKTSLILKHNGK